MESLHNKNDVLPQKPSNIDIEPYYDYFMKKYKEHYKLFYPIGTSDKELYKICMKRINYIMRKLLMDDSKLKFDNEYLNVQTNDGITFVKKKSTKCSTIQNEYFFISKTTKFNIISRYGFKNS